MDLVTSKQLAETVAVLISFGEFPRVLTVVLIYRADDRQSGRMRISALHKRCVFVVDLVGPNIGFSRDVWTTDLVVFARSPRTGHSFSSPEMVSKRTAYAARKVRFHELATAGRLGHGIGAPYHAPTRVCTVAPVHEGIMQSVGTILRAIRMLDRCPCEDTTRKSRPGLAAIGVARR